MVSVTVDDVRDVINISDSDIPDAKVTKMIKRAEVTLELETDEEIDYSDCTEAVKGFNYNRQQFVESAVRDKNEKLKYLEAVRKE